MAYGSRKTRSDKKVYDQDKNLRIQQPLSSDRQVVKIGEDSTGLLLKDKDVLIEGEATVGGDLTVGGNTLTFGNSEVIHNETDDMISFSTPTLQSDGATKHNSKAQFILAAYSGTDAYINFFEGGAIRWTIGNDADDDKFKIDNNAVVGGSTQLSLDTSGNLTLAGDLQVNGDDIKCDGAMNLEAEGGAITLDSSTGNFLAKKDGTEFSVANSAYGGMILGYHTAGIDAADSSYTLSNTMSAIADDLKVKFVAPPSGVVEISIQVYLDAARRGVIFGLSDRDKTTGYRAISFPNAEDVTNEHLVVIPPTASGDSVLNNSWVVTGLTSGTAYEWWLGAKTNIATGGVLRWGGNAGNKYPPFIMKAVALPNPTPTFAVYG